MKKTKYRYKCMICGTETVSADDMFSCSACGSDELAKFEIAPVVDIVEKTPKKRSCRRKSITPSSRRADAHDIPYLIGSLRSLDPAPPMPKPMSSYIIPPPPPPTRMERIVEKIKHIAGKVPWKNLFKIAATLVIGGVVYRVVRLFI